MRVIELIVLVGVLSGIVAASPLPEYPFVYVRGFAEQAIAPDKASVNFNTRGYDKEAQAAYNQLTESGDRLLAFLQELGVPSESVIAEAIEKNEVRKERGDESGEIVGYEAERNIRIEISDLSIFPKLVAFLDTQSQIRHVFVSFGRKDEQTIVKELTGKACQNARDNAERLSAGFKSKIKGIKAISESGFPGIGRPFGLSSESERQVQYAPSIPGGRREFKVIPATITFRKDVFAIFEIQ